MGVVAWEKIGWPFLSFEAEMKWMSPQQSIFHVDKWIFLFSVMASCSQETYQMASFHRSYNPSTKLIKIFLSGKYMYIFLVGLLLWRTTHMWWQFIVVQLCSPNSTKKYLHEFIQLYRFNVMLITFSLIRNKSLDYAWYVFIFICYISIVLSCGA